MEYRYVCCQCCREQVHTSANREGNLISWQVGAGHKTTATLEQSRTKQGKLISKIVLVEHIFRTMRSGYCTKAGSGSECWTCHQEQATWRNRKSILEPKQRVLLVYGCNTSNVCCRHRQPARLDGGLL